MNGTWINIKANDGGSFKAYLSPPPGLAQGRKGPGIVLLQEIWGVNQHIRAVADQYAMDGYTVLAPDVFWRIEPGVDLTYDKEGSEKAFSLMKKMDFKAVTQDLIATVKTLRELPAGNGRVATVGFCMGGYLSYIAAAHAGVDAAVCYYGGGIQNQLGEAAKIKCPIMLHYAEKDHFIPMEAVESVRQAFAGRDNTRIDVYPGVDHGFNCWERPAYDQGSAALARGRTLAFLATHL